MKFEKITYLTLFVCFLNMTNAQVSENKSILPVDYDSGKYIRYYYYPNLEAYYDNLRRIFHYKIEGKWTNSKELPNNYCGYSLFNKTRVIITDFDGDDPRKLLQIHKKLYPYNSKGRFSNPKSSTKGIVVK